ncbi:hypothetical protein C9890_0141 [Perkinsus sp. BL_2016]|nr:hypothetical protein C9890_0141 [Perkinsus sp. BL_2016]
MKKSATSPTPSPTINRRSNSARSSTKPRPATRAASSASPKRTIGSAIPTPPRRTTPTLPFMPKKPSGSTNFGI